MEIMDTQYILRFCFTLFLFFDFYTRRRVFTFSGFTTSFRDMISQRVTIEVVSYACVLALIVSFLYNVDTTKVCTAQALQLELQNVSCLSVNKTFSLKVNKLTS